MNNQHSGHHEDNNYYNFHSWQSKHYHVHLQMNLNKRLNRVPSRNACLGGLTGEVDSIVSL